MTRLLVTAAWDVRLQLRNGFYYAAGIMVLFWIMLLRLLPEHILRPLMPPLVLGNLVINTFYFVGGLVLLEKREGTLEAQVVTPLRTWEYLTAKVATLTLLSLAENLLIVLVLFGPAVDLLPVAAGIMAASALYTLAGFMAVARFDSINEYLLPSMLYLMVLTAPLLASFAVREIWLLYLHPLQAPLILLQAGFHPESVGRLLYGVISSLAWMVPGYYWARTAFNRHIIAREGSG